MATITIYFSLHRLIIYVKLYTLIFYDKLRLTTYNSIKSDITFYAMR